MEKWCEINSTVQAPQRTKRPQKLIPFFEGQQAGRLTRRFKSPGTLRVHEKTRNPFHFRVSRHMNYFSFSINTGLNPMLGLSSSGILESRLAERQAPGSLAQLPPRLTRYFPLFGPFGFGWFVVRYPAYQSRHHSQTFPCIS